MRAPQGYEIIDKVGEGGMAEVYRARQLSLDRVVAIKFLSPRLVMDSEAVQQFRTEAQAAARLKHPGIVQVYDAGDMDGQAYYIMEFVSGVPLGRWLRRHGPLDEARALGMAAGVAVALGYAWREARLIHCDIKPDNILIDNDGTVKVTDLGLAKITGAAGREADETIAGTPHYISPEQAVGLQDLDCRTDIYALGASMYHALTGQMPFGDLPPRKVLEAQVSAFLADPCELNPQVSLPVGWLVEKMLVKDRTRRPANWEDICMDIAAVRGGEYPAEPLPPPGLSTVQRGAARAQRQPPRANAATDKTPRKKITLAREPLKETTAARPRPRTDWLRLAIWLVLLAVGVGGGYWVWQQVQVEQQRAATQQRAEYARALPPRPNLPANAPKLRLGVPENSADAAAIPPEDATPEAAASGAAWNDADFQKAGQLFNGALKRYEQYTKDHSQTAILQEVEEQCRAAAELFESLQGKEPPGTSLENYIQQCYKLISDCRQQSIVTTSSGAERPRTVTLAERKKDLFKASQLQLPPGWEVAVPPADAPEVQAFEQLLGSWCKPEVNLDPDPSLHLFAHITYLMPAVDAARLSGGRLGERTPATGQIFPPDCFFYYSLRGTFGSGFHTMLLLTDSANAVVGIQFINDAPEGAHWIGPQFFEDGRQVYDFVQGLKVEAAAAKIAYRISNDGNMLRVDAECAARQPDAPFELGASTHRTSLILPERIANILYSYVTGAQRTP